MIYTIFILLCVAEFMVILSINKEKDKLEKAVTKLHGELDSIGKENIFYKGENECLRRDVENAGALNRDLRSRLSRKNCKRKKVETQPIVKK